MDAAEFTSSRSMQTVFSRVIWNTAVRVRLPVLQIATRMHITKCIVFVDVVNAFVRHPTRRTVAFVFRHGLALALVLVFADLNTQFLASFLRASFALCVCRYHDRMFGSGSFSVEEYTIYWR